jgi:hypothetical protein
MESAVKAAGRAGGQIVAMKARRDSQGSLPKTGFSAYLYDNATEL